jgi:opacity protein-like surface antigen
MILRHTLLASALFLSVSLSFAENLFTGFSVYTGIGAEKSSGHTDNFRDSITGNPQPVIKEISFETKPIMNFGMSYTFPVYEKFLLGFGAELNPFRVETGKNKLFYNGSYFFSEKDIPKKRFSLFISPSYQITDDSLLYGKIGYTRVNVEVTNDYIYPPENLTMNGMIFGVGIKKFIYNKIYAYGEVNYLDYEDQNHKLAANKLSTFDNYLTSTNGLIGVGYQF